MKTARAPNLEFDDQSDLQPETSPSRKRKSTQVLEKEESTTKVVEKELPVSDDDLEWDDELGLEDGVLERDDGEPVDMDVLEKYENQVLESEGFDFVDYPGYIFGITNIMPRQFVLDKPNVFHKEYKKVVDFATRALATYNKANTDYNVLEIEKLNIEGCKATTYYMTFSAMEAKHSEHGENIARKIFQAKVMDDVIDKTFEVQICRLVAPK